MEPTHSRGQGDVLLTKIIATVGPSCLDVGVLVKLIDEGVRVFRINFSHGTVEGFAKALAAIREAGKLTGEHVAALGDLSGPKIRVGKVQDGGILLEAEKHVAFVREPLVAVAAAGTADAPIIFSTTFPPMIDDVQPGQRLLINDGEFQLHVDGTDGTGEKRRLLCTVKAGGLVTSSKGINLPDTALSTSAVTPYDWKCVEWAVENELDFLALSFVRKAMDLKELRAGLKQMLANAGKSDTLRMSIIAKIEKPQALDELDAIVQEADAVMVARGDLGVEMDVSEVPVIQKRIIAAAHALGKPAVVATQMLQSMIESPVPTRAEVSDVANAIFDGADAVMLSGETAVGKWPIDAVRMMARIARTSNRHYDEVNDIVGTGEHPALQTPTKIVGGRYRTAALSHGVRVVVRDLGARLVVTWSQQAGGARYLSQNRFRVPIIAASSSPAALRRMAILHAVIPVFAETPANKQVFIAAMDTLILARKLGAAGDPVVVVTGEPIGVAGVTNGLQIHYVGEVCGIGERRGK
jgi:pyruvate kinase